MALMLKMFSEAWLLASVDLGDTGAHRAHPPRAGGQRGLARMVGEMSKEFAKISRRRCARSSTPPPRARRDDQRARGPAAAKGARGQGEEPGEQTPGADAYTVDLTQRAKDGKIDPVLGRDFGPPGWSTC
ncbi:MAG: hypothetical protein U0133_11000 [Gemmatimonadales bacterium]